MEQRTWLITGVSSGLGKAMAGQLLARGDRVIGTVRYRGKVADFLKQYPWTFKAECLDLTKVQDIHSLVGHAFLEGEVDVVVSNAGYGLFGAAEEVSDSEIDHIIATNLVGSMQFIRTAIPHMRRQRSGRIIQISSYGGIVAYPGSSVYHATKFGIEGFCEAVAREIAPFGIGMTIVEPGGARTQFRYGNAKVARDIPAYDGTPAHAFLSMLNPANGLAPGDPERMAKLIIASVDQNPAPLRLMLGARALKRSIASLKKRLAEYEKQADTAALADFPETQGASDAQ